MIIEYSIYNVQEIEIKQTPTENKNEAKDGDINSGEPSSDNGKIRQVIVCWSVQRGGGSTTHGPNGPQVTDTVPVGGPSPPSIAWSKNSNLIHTLSLSLYFQVGVSLSPP
ncbi:unnamed protein product [Ilex paraguariensis]|uniref:Uncharacterized protein n=1 Tax=Ilex paraguariensis TaxID=185542 RepID=A0ABC8UJ62_9AQUA